MGSTTSMIGLAVLSLVVHILIDVHFFEQEKLLNELKKEEEVNQSISEIKSLQTEIETLKAEIKSLEIGIEASQNNHSNCTSDLVTANHHHSHYKKQAESLKTKVQDLDQQNSNCTRELAEQISLNAMQTIQSNQSIKSLQFQMETSEKKYLSEIKSLQVEIQALEKKYSNCTFELAQVNDRKSHSKKPTESLKTEMQKSSQQISDYARALPEEKSLSSSKIKSLDVELEKQRLSTESRDAELNQSKSEIKSLKHELKTFKEKYSNCTSDLAQANERNSHSKEQMESLKRDYEIMYHVTMIILEIAKNMTTLCQ